MTTIALKMRSWDKQDYSFTKFTHCDLLEDRLW